MKNPSELYQTATAICDVLPFLAPALAPELKSLLKRATAGEDVEVAILDLLNEHENTREWLQDKLAERTSCSERGFSSLPGDSTSNIIGIKQYCCPRAGCRRKWFMHRIGQKIPQCPDHPVQFVEVATV